jgi:sortase A
VTELQASIATRAPELPPPPATAGRSEAPPAPTPDPPSVEPGDPPADAPGGRTIQIPDIPYARLGGLALIGVAALIILFLVYLFAFTPLSANRSQQRLSSSLVGHRLTLFQLVNGKIPPQGAAVAVLQIPALGLHQVVVEGTSAADLMNGPGLMPGSALPGSPGNSVIAARRVTFGGPFGSLNSLRTGDRIVTVDGAGTFTYRVTKIRTVDAGQTDVVVPTSDDRITLVTSNSNLVTSGRLVVQGKLLGTPVAVPDNIVAVPSYDLGLSGDPAAGGLAVLWSVITLLVLLGAALAIWRWRRPWLVYLFAAPVLMACGLFACESVARALPATF